MTLLLIGQTGCGKSSLGNFLLGDKTSFLVSGGPYLQTRVPNYRTKDKLTIIDTAGFGEDHIKDNERLKFLISYIKQFGYINGILIVINSQQRITQDYKTFIKEFYNYFGFSALKNTAIVFTHCYFSHSGKSKEIREKCIRQANYLKELIEIKFDLKYFFIDSDMDDDDIDYESLEEKNKIINWGKYLEAISP